MLSSIWSRLFQRQTSSRRAGSVSDRRTRRHRPAFDALEDRLVLSTLFWVGNHDSNWSTNTAGTNTNWSPDQIPNTGDLLIFSDSSAVNFTTTNDMPGFTFSELRFLQNTAFHVTGVPLTLSGGITVFDQGSHKIDVDIALTNGSHTIDVAAGAAVELGRGVSGAAGITKTGAGTLTYSGTIANTYTGLTAVQDGMLQLGKDIGVAAMNGNLSIGDAVGAAGSAVAKLLLSSQIPNTKAVGANSDGLFDVNNKIEIIGNLSTNGSVAIGSGTFTVSSMSMTGGSISSTGAGSLVMNGDFDSINAAVTCTISGTLDLGGGTRVFDVFDSPNFYDVDINGAIINGALTKNGNGVLHFIGSSPNTYSGTTTVNTGGLILGKAAGTDAIVGSLVIGDGIGPGLADAVQLDGDNQIADSTSVTIAASGFLQLFGGSDTIGPLQMTGGLVNIFTDKVCTLSGGAIVNVSANAATIGGVGQLSLGGGNQTFTVNDGAATNDLVITAAIVSGGVTKAGTGSLVFEGPLANTYAGLTVVNAGLLVLNKDSGVVPNAAFAGNLLVGDGFGLPGTAGVKLLQSNQIPDTAAVSTNPDGAFDVNGMTEIIVSLGMGLGPVTIGAGTLTVNGPVSMDTAAISSTGVGKLVLGGNVTVLTNLTGGSSISGTLDLGSATRTFDVANGPAANDLTITGLITGGGGLIKTGAGTLLFNDPTTNISNSYAGATTVKDGTLVLDGHFFEGAIPGSLTIGDGTGVANSAVVRLLLDREISNSAAVTVNSDGLLDLGGASNNEDFDSLSGSGHVELNGATLTVGGAGSTTFSGTITGTGGLTKTGAAALTLSGTSSYSGDTNVNNGTLLVTGTLTNSNVKVNAGATLGGTGTCSGIVQLQGGSLAPGTSPGTIIVEDFMVPASGVLSIEINGTTPGVTYDQIIIGGSVNLTNCTLVVSLGFAPAIGATFTIINNVNFGNTFGEFNDMPEGQVVTLGGKTFQITYVGGTDNNDVVLTRINTGIFVVGPDKGSEPRVFVYDSLTAVEKFPSFLAFGPTFKGGVRVATGDVNGDGIPDIICAPGAGGTAVNGAAGIRVFNGVDGTPLPGTLGTGFNPFGPTFKKGFWVAAGDFNNDGKADIAAAPNGGFVPEVKVISGADGTTVLADLTTLFPATGTYKKGVRLAASDVTGDDRPDLIATSGTGTFAQAKVLNGTNFQPVAGMLGAGFNPFDDHLEIKSALNVAAGDVDGDGLADLIFAPGKSSQLVRVIDELGATLMQFPGVPTTAYKGGLRVGITDKDGDGKADVVVGTGKAKGVLPRVDVVDPETQTDLVNLSPLGLFKGGLFVAGSN